MLWVLRGANKRADVVTEITGNRWPSVFTVEQTLRKETAPLPMNTGRFDCLKKGHKA